MRDEGSPVVARVCDVLCIATYKLSGAKVICCCCSVEQISLFLSYFSVRLRLCMTGRKNVKHA